VALDGATKEVYEQVRKGPFSFEEVRDNVERFLTMKRGLSKPHTILSIIIMEKTAPELNRFRDFWQRRGADQVLFKDYANWGSQDQLFTDLALPEQRARYKSPRPHKCKFLWESVIISWDGRVVPCCFDYDTKVVLGDLKQSTLAEIWNGPAYVALRRAELEGRNNNPLCANCSEAPGHARDPHWGEDVLVSLSPRLRIT